MSNEVNPDAVVEEYGPKKEDVVVDNTPTKELVVEQVNRPESSEPGTETEEERRLREKRCKCYADARKSSACPPIKNVTHPLRYYEFTPEELKALEECDRESFYRRCLPLSTTLATATYIAVKKGVLKRNPHFGAVPKVTFAFLAGHVIGRLSSIGRCDERLRKKLPDDSYLGNVLREYHKKANPPPEENQS
ncbi:unnamed protein product [Plutella xylostella]|uniref:(diamondback moth) hypothetical protein n=1 Tax=Plutella xylostella TaxID=51655 RepID=A0A8S4GH40_PLUXY|nr:OCIA domain-containing protein 1 [Plutella xylostella]CAG9138218.1 unnamed protein product [Plutella xylostella]